MNKKEDPAMLLLEALHGDPSKAILDQESRGQSKLVNDATLPAEISLEDRASLESQGVVFGEYVEGDKMFRYVTLPAGWKKVRTDHSLWSELHNEKGKIMASIFYKAAFYDRSSHMYVPKAEGE